MSPENNSTSSDTQKPKNLTPDEIENQKIAKVIKDKTDLIKWTKNSIEVKKISDINAYMEGLAKSLNILEIPDNLENKIRNIAKKPKNLASLKRKIKYLTRRNKFDIWELGNQINQIERRDKKYLERKKSEDKLKADKEANNKSKKIVGKLEDIWNTLNKNINKEINIKDKKEITVDKKEITEKIKIKEDITVSKKMVDNVKNLASVLKWNKEASEFVSTIEGIENFSKENIKEALNLLRKNPQKLRQIAVELKQKDKKEWTNSYKSFKRAVSFDPQISIILDSFEAKAGGVSVRTIGKLSAGVSGVKGSVDGDSVSFESGGTVVNSDKWMTTLSLEGSDYAMESNPEEVNENLARAKKIREKASEEVEPLAKNIFGLESLIKVIEQNSDNFEQLKTALWDINSKIYKNIPDNQKSSIKNMVESSNTPMDLIAKIMVFKNPWFSAYLTPHIYKI